jgi:HAMP domain-containing protein
MRQETPRRATLLLGAAVVVLALLSFFAGSSLTGALDRLLDLRRLAQEEMLGPPLVYALLLLQSVLIAIPFVPGAEVGLLLLALCGAQLAIEVYAATVAGLLLAFGVGRAVPQRSVQRLLVRLGLDRAGAAVERLARDAILPAPSGTSRMRRLGGRLLRHRGLCLVLLINTPGNTLLGGGGGIALAAGLSRLFSFRQFLASVLVAVAPVPAFVLLMAAFA